MKDIEIKTMKVGKQFILTQWHDENDYSVWVTDDVEDSSSGWSVRGIKEEIAKELRNKEFNLTDKEVEEMLDETKGGK